MSIGHDACAYDLERADISQRLFISARPSASAPHVGGSRGVQRLVRTLRVLGAVAAFLAAVLMAPGAARAEDPPTCNGLAVTVLGSDGDDALEGGAGSDVIHGLGGNDTISGYAGADVICGGDGRDVIRAGGGDDIVNGARGNDTIGGDAGGDLIYGVLGNDRIVGGLGDDEIGGGIGKDRLRGGDGKDLVHGGPDDDLVVGGIGTDMLAGGEDNDVLKGSAGYDTLLGVDGSSGDTLDGGRGLALCRADFGDTQTDCVTTADVEGGNLSLEEEQELTAALEEMLGRPLTPEEQTALPETFESTLNEQDRIMEIVNNVSKALHDLAISIISKIG